MRSFAMCAAILLCSSVALAETPAEEVAKRLETITSKSARAKLDVPKFANDYPRQRGTCFLIESHDCMDRGRLLILD